MRPASHLLLLALLVATAPARAADVSFGMVRDGDVFRIEASAEFRGAIGPTWRVLTDYARYAEYIPQVRESRVLARRGREVDVEQKGEAHVLFLEFPIAVRLAVTEHPYERITSRSTAGSFREMRNTYWLEAGEGRVLLRYSGRLVPDFYVPPLLGTLLLKRHAEAVFAALVEEMERQNAGSLHEK